MSERSERSEGMRSEGVSERGEGVSERSEG